MLTRRLIVLLKKARLACSLTYPTFLPSYGPYGPYGPSVTYGGLGPATAGPASRSLTYPTFLPSYGPYGPYGRSRSAVTYSLCDVRRPRAGYGRPGVTVWRSRQTS
ncbi:hypothetical protein L249_4239 [Ophiocordyceps polyrhachis-furcata BCC 54312]|uniref:Uncharacterized protein n=1 Tax=Ophiocordyceps polyrhachis-furcata BCC 54312 TaxID=1330021 RepID=A0A367L8B2_9HYPO|nr:hypothetical protein L249_4239 [Ophiocordyceps polyrhachis-furcata BCC 54312]